MVSYCQVRVKEAVIEVSLRFGNRALNLNIPQNHVLGVLTPNSVRPKVSPDRLVRQHLEATTVALENKKTVIVVPDKTRNCGATVFLPILVGRLNHLGVSDEEIKIILANGSHVPNDANEVRKIVGDGIARRIKILQHDCHDADALTFVGKTKFGTPVILNRIVLETPQVIIGGTAVHHYFAGYGGGPKMINPGCAGYETITANHALTIDARAGRIHPNCRASQVQGNPVQEDIRDSMRFVAVDLLLETVLNERREIVDVFVGELFETHDRACKRVDEIYRVPISVKADLVVASCGGFPKDINMIQAHKTIHNAFQAVKKNGVLLVLAECAHGIGSATFMAWFEYADVGEQIQALTENYKLNGTTALSLRRKCERAKIVFVSKLPDGIVRKTGMLPARDLQEGWQTARSHLPENFTCYLMPNGSLTLPVLI